MADLRRIFQEHLPNPGYCLVLRPFREEFSEVWGIVRNALSKDFNWTDVASLNGGGEIMEEVLRAIARTDAVIVDISEPNPNVFYELGVARLAKGDKKVILVKQTQSAVPFDIQGIRYLDYLPTPVGVRTILPELKARIRQALESTTWFRLAEGETHKSEPLPGQDGNYQFEVRAVSLVGGSPGPEAIGVDLTVHEYPVNEMSEPARLSTRLFSKKSCEIPKLPWRLKFENFEFDNGKKKAVICIIPEGTT